MQMLDQEIAWPTPLRVLKNRTKIVYVRSVDTECLEHVFRMDVFAAF